MILTYKKIPSQGTHEGIKYRTERNRTRAFYTCSPQSYIDLYLMIDSHLSGKHAYLYYERLLSRAASTGRRNTLSL